MKNPLAYFDYDSIAGRPRYRLTWLGTILCCLLGSMIGMGLTLAMGWIIAIFR